MNSVCITFTVVQTIASQSLSWHLYKAYPTLALWTVKPPNVDEVCLILQIVLTGAIPYPRVNGLTVGILHLNLLKLKTTMMTTSN